MEERRMYRPVGTSSAEHHAKGSRFLARILPASGEKEAKRLAEACRAEFPDATHVVYAFRSGGRGDIFGMSDDGEPQGTAGRPVLEVLRGAELTDAVLLVLRWFGGTKLGTGGLVKAYTRAAQLVLEQSVQEELVDRIGFSLLLPYRCYEKGRELLDARGAQITGEEFTEQVRITGRLPRDEQEAAASELQELSAGAAEIAFSECGGA